MTKQANLMKGLTGLAMVFLIGTTNCQQHPNSQQQNASEQLEKTVQATPAEEPIPTLCLYTIGDVKDKLRDAMLDSLKSHYPRCEFKGNIPLQHTALTEKRKDHARYRADILNMWLTSVKRADNIVIGLTQVDIGMDNFRGHPHWGIMGLASGINSGVAVCSSYRPRNNNELFGVMIHEIGHALGLHHCADESCMMQNAEGGNSFRKTHTFCNKCKEHLKKRHWTF